MQGGLQGARSILRAQNSGQTCEPHCSRGEFCSVYAKRDEHFFNVMRKAAIVMLETSRATLQNLATGERGARNLGHDIPLRFTIRHTA